MRKICKQCEVRTHDSKWNMCYECATVVCIYCKVIRHHKSRLACTECVPDSAAIVAYCRWCSRPVYQSRYESCYTCRHLEMDELVGLGRFIECYLCHERYHDKRYRQCWPCSQPDREPLEILPTLAPAHAGGASYPQQTVGTPVG